MKKTVLGIAVITSSLCAQAATVYDKDGTSLDLGGRVQSVLYSTKHEQAAGDHDATIKNSARFSIGGKTKLNDFISGFGFAEWDMADGKDEVTAREQYVGADFNDYGKLYAGKTYDAVKHVIEATDVFEDDGGLAQPESDDFRNGTLKYEYDNHGIYASASLQTAADSQPVYGEDDAMNVDSGFALSTGYTFDDVLFGPLAFNLGYSYIRLQNDDGMRPGIPEANMYVVNGRNVAASVAWGSTDSGPYLAALYTDKKWKFTGNIYGYTKGYELVAGYGFDNGISAFAGFESAYETMKDANGNKMPSLITRTVPVYVNYSANENFNIWAEARFAAGSTPKFGNAYYHDNTGSIFSVGARYTF